MAAEVGFVGLCQHIGNGKRNAADAQGKDSAVRDLLNDTFGNLNINGARIAVGADRKRLMLALDDEICL